MDRTARLGGRPPAPGGGHGGRRGPRRGAAALVLAVVGLAGAAACQPADAPPPPGARTWIRNMWTGPVVMPHTDARVGPERAMAVDGVRRLNRREARLGLTNPLDATPAVLAEGEALYAAYCALCHGADGTGDGQLAGHYRRMPDLTARYVLNYPAGFVYTIIREGGRNMPRFGDALDIDERWALVHYLGTLGGAAAAEAAPAEAASR